jgi:hypothetical protein
MAVGGRAVVVAGVLLAALTGAGMARPEAPAAAGERVAVPASVPTGTVPVLGDFDGDGRDDLLWYGPGAPTTTSGWAGRAGTSPGCR